MFERAIFFDNDQKNLDSMSGVCRICRDVQCVKINDSGRGYLIPWTNPDVVKYVEDKQANSYYLLCKTVFADASFDKLSGIHESHIQMYIAWKEDTPGFRRAAIFDWDRTISLFEGIAIHPESKTIAELKGSYIKALRALPGQEDKAKILEGLPDVTAHDTLIYLLGGEARLKMMRDLFQDCQSSGIDIIIISNNSACKFPVFNQLLQELFQTIPYTLICSNSKTPLHRGSTIMKGKGDFLYEQGLCVKRGGKRSGKRSKKRTKKKRSTRK